MAAQTERPEATVTELPHRDSAGAVERHRATGALAIQTDQQEWTPAQHAALVQLGLGDAPAGDLAVFLTYAQRTQLDPWARQLYMIGRKSKSWDPATRTESWTMKYTIQASIDGLRIVAQRTGDYAGQVGPEWCGPDGVWRDVWLPADPPSAARVGVLRKGWSAPQYAVAVFREYAGYDTRGNLTKMWSEKSSLMIAKCAEALALRKAFPHDLSGVYTAEEMTRADVVEGQVVPDGRDAQRPATSSQRPQPTVDDVAAALASARSRTSLTAALAGLAFTPPLARMVDGTWQWEDTARARLSALRISDSDGTSAPAWDVIRAVGAQLPVVDPPASDPPSDDGYVDPDQSEDTAAGAVEGITEDQLTAVNTIATTRGMNDRDARLAWLSEWTDDGRQLSSSTQMTKSEAHRLLDEMARRERAAAEQDGAHQ